MEVVSSLDQLGPTRGEFKAFLQDLSVSEEDVEHWGLVFTEAFVNSVRYGIPEGGGAEQTRIKLCWKAVGDRVTLEVQDEGPGIPESRLSHMELPDDPLNERGRGLFLMKSYCDVVESWTRKDKEGHLLFLSRRHEGLDPDSQTNSLLDSTFEELNSSFESLSAFYRLGNALISASNVSDFILASFDNLKTVVAGDVYFTGWPEVVDEAIRGDLNALPISVQWHREGNAFDPILQGSPEWIFDKAEEMNGIPGMEGFEVACCLPIKAAGRVLGYMGVARRAGGAVLVAKELNLLRTFADLFGIAVAHADNAVVRTREQQALREVEIAAELQETLVPASAPPPNPHWDIFLMRQGARSVSGDYTEAMETPSGRLLLVIVDVMGKGVSAAFLAGMLRTALRLQMSSEANLGKLIEQLNTTLCTLLGDLTLFATVAMVMVDLKAQSLDCVNAGHCPIILRQDGEVVREIHPSGPPLGLFADHSYSVETLDLNKGLEVLMITDGIYEWETGLGALWGYPAFLDFLKQYLSDPKGLWEGLKDERKQHGEESGLEDDQTLLYWKFKG